MEVGVRVVLQVQRLIIRQPSIMRLSQYYFSLANVLIKTPHLDTRKSTYSATPVPAPHTSHKHTAASSHPQSPTQHYSATPDDPGRADTASETH